MQKREFLIDNLKNSRTSRSKGGMTYIWYDMPYNLYLDQEQAEAYLEMIQDESFAVTLHDPVVRLVDQYSHEIIEDVANDIEFYDLGPGLPTKTIPLLKCIRAKDIHLRYVPVDISTSFLELTEQEISKYGIKSHGVNALFEDLPNILESNPHLQNNEHQHPISAMCFPETVAFRLSSAIPAIA